MSCLWITCSFPECGTITKPWIQSHTELQPWTAFVHLALTQLRLDCMQALLIVKEVDDGHEHQNHYKWSPPWESIHCCYDKESGLPLRDIFLILNMSWPDFSSSAIGIWLLYCWAQCDQSGMCRTSQMKMKTSFLPSLTSSLSGNQWYTTWRLLDIMYLFYWTQLQCWPNTQTFGWLYGLKLTFSSIQNRVTWIRTRPSLFSSF